MYYIVVEKWEMGMVKRLSYGSVFNPQFTDTVAI